MSQPARPEPMCRYCGRYVVNQAEQIPDEVIRQRMAKHHIFECSTYQEYQAFLGQEAERARQQAVEDLRARRYSFACGFGTCPYIAESGNPEISERLLLQHAEEHGPAEVEQMRAAILDGAFIPRGHGHVWTRRPDPESGPRIVDEETEE